jgi:hypothetical protein
MNKQVALESIMEIDMNFRMGCLTMAEYAMQIQPYWLWLVDNDHDVVELLEGKLYFALSLIGYRTGKLPEMA